MKTLNACLLGLLLLPSPTLADSITGIRQVPLLTNDLVYDAAEGTIYASVPGLVGASGNRLTPIAPGTGTVGSGVDDVWSDWEPPMVRGADRSKTVKHGKTQPQARQVQRQVA